MSFWDVEAQLRPVLLRREYVAITAGLASAVLLSQLVFWFKPGKFGKPKLTIYREGKYWLAKTRTEWWEECGITLKMYRNAVQDLQELGLVEVQFWKFANQKMSHLWLNLEALEALLRFHGFVSQPLGQAQKAHPVNPNEPKGHTPVSPKGTTQCAQKAHPLYTEITTESTTEITKTVLQAALLGQEKISLTLGHKEGTEDMAEIQASKHLATAMYAGKSASAVLAGLKAKKETASGVGEALHLRWKKEYAGMYDEFHGEMTMADKGKLGRISKAVGKDKALDIITWAVRNWQKFAITAKDQKGLGGAPERPVVGFLLQHYSVALECLSLLASPIAGSPKGAATQPKPLQQETPKASEPKGPTESLQSIAGDDEMQKLMKELGI